MAQGLSEQSQAQWAAFARSVGSDGSGPLDRELLDQFLIGVHRRGEELSAHDLGMLVEELEAEVATELARETTAFVEPALALLEAYDRSHVDAGDDASEDDDSGDDDDSEGAYVGDADVAPGILVI